MTGERAVPCRANYSEGGKRRSCICSLVFLQATFSLLNMTNGPIRLWRNGNSSTEFTSGRVQLVYDSVWGNICWDANFELTEADVICHQLGYTGALDYDRASDDE